MTNDEIVHYWIKSAEYDFATMNRNFSSGEYVWALFIGHLVIEKLLKACCARTTGNEVPRNHNLLFLAEMAGIELNENQKEALNTPRALSLIHI